MSGVASWIVSGVDESLSLKKFHSAYRLPAAGEAIQGVALVAPFPLPGPSAVSHIPVAAEALPAIASIAVSAAMRGRVLVFMRPVSICSNLHPTRVRLTGPAAPSAAFFRGCPATPRRRV